MTPHRTRKERENMAADSKQKRRTQLKMYLENNPFLTDEVLADKLDVSVQTIRLDRAVLDIPDVRERTRRVAEENYSRVRSINSGEIVGQLLDLHLGDTATSLLETNGDMAFEKTNIVRSHFIFAQAESLALAVIDADVAVTGLANIKYKKQVKPGEKLLAEAEVIRRKGDDKCVVLVESASGGEEVFRGKFVVFALGSEGDG